MPIRDGVGMTDDIEPCKVVTYTPENLDDSDVVLNGYDGVFGVYTKNKDTIGYSTSICLTKDMKVVINKQGIFVRVQIFQGYIVNDMPRKILDAYAESVDVISHDIFKEAPNGTESISQAC